MRPIPPPKKEEPPRSFFANLQENLAQTRQGFLLAWRASPSLGVVICVLTVVSAILPPVIAYVGKLIIDAVVAHDASSTIKTVIAEFFLIALVSIVQRTLFLSRTLLGNRLGIEVNTSILKKAVRLDLSQIENSEFYDKMNRARQEASSRSLQLVTDSFQFLQNGLTLFGYVALLFSYSAWAATALIVASLPATWAEMKFSNIGFKLYNWRSPDRRKMAYMEYVLANDSHAKEVRVFGLSARFLTTYQSLAERFFKEDRALATKRTVWVVLLTLLSSGAFYGCYLSIAYTAAMGNLTLGNLSLYVVVFRQGQQSFQSCLAAIGGMYEHNLYLSNLFDFLAIPEVSNKQEVPRGAAMAPVEEGIFFDLVTFQYPGREKPALKNFTLKVPKGQSVAIVGANGAGKSTLIKLLCGLYRPTIGRIFLDGVDIEHWNKNDLQEKISVVFQDFNRYQLTLQENVGVGDVGSIENRDLISRAMERGGAGELLNQLPKGIDTALGNWFFGGMELSGGQWQKVAVSRAFMRENAQILILDEPTAALDAEAENVAFHNFRELTKGKTSIIISHRFPVARLADHIVVLEAGEILEQGTHQELLQTNRRYAGLFALQAKGYLD